MEPDTARSEQVIEQYKKHKLLASGLRKIQAVILGYEKDREIDKSVAAIGLVIIVLLLAIVVYVFMNTEIVTIS